MPKPVFYKPDQIERALDDALKGLSLTRIIENMGTYNKAFWRYRKENPEFERSFNQARQNGLEILADRLIDMHDEQPDVNKARLASDNYKWLLSKRKPLIYGERLDINLNQTVDIRGALGEAKQRALKDVTHSIEQDADRNPSLEAIPEDEDIFS